MRVESIPDEVAPHFAFVSASSNQRPAKMTLTNAIKLNVCTTPEKRQETTAKSPAAFAHSFCRLNRAAYSRADTDTTLHKVKLFAIESIWSFVPSICVSFHVIRTIESETQNSRHTGLLRAPNRSDAAAAMKRKLLLIESFMVCRRFSGVGFPSVSISVLPHTRAHYSLEA